MQECIEGGFTIRAMGKGWHYDAVNGKKQKKLKSAMKEIFAVQLGSKFGDTTSTADESDYVPTHGG